jgi:hypothetical protein
MAHRFANHLEAVQGSYRGPDRRRIGPLAASGLDQLAVAAPCEQGIEEERLRRTRDEAGTNLTEDRGIKPGLGELQAQHVFPVDAAAHSSGRLAIGESFGKLQDRDQRQPPRGVSRLPMRGKEGQQGVIREQGLQCIGHTQVPVALGKCRAGDTGRFRGDGFDRHRAKHGAPPSICLKL